MYSKNILWSVDGVNYIYSEMTRNNLHIPVDNAKIDIMSILRRCKQIIISCQKA